MDGNSVQIDEVHLLGKLLQTLNLVADLNLTLHVR